MRGLLRKSIRTSLSEPEDHSSSLMNPSTLSTKLSWWMKKIYATFVGWVLLAEGGADGGGKGKGGKRQG